MNIIIVDPASFILPYDFYFISALAEKGYRIDFFCSNTSYNNDYLSELSNTQNVHCHTYDISSTSSGRILGLFNYLAMLTNIFFLCFKKNISYVHFQFQIFFPLECVFFLLLRRRLVVTIHNPVPHNSTKKKTLPLALTNLLCESLVFPSQYTKSAFCSAYRSRTTQRRTVIQHGVLPIYPQEHTSSSPTLPHKILNELIFWGNIKPYKGVEILKNLISFPNTTITSIRVYGKWDKEMLGLKNTLMCDGAYVMDKFLDRGDLIKIFNRPAIFILPYLAASQSGIMYTLIYYCIPFISSDTGDTADFLRKYGLGSLIFTDRAPDTVFDCIHYVQNNLEFIKKQLFNAKQDFSWRNSITNINLVYQ